MAVTEQIDGYQHIALSYEEVAADAREALQKLEGMEFDSVLAISCGGLMVAQTVAYELGTRRITTIGTAKYEGSIELPEAVITAHPDPDLMEDQHVLVVDDVYDTGATYDLVDRVYGPLPAQGRPRRVPRWDDNIRARSLTLLTPHFKPDKNLFRHRKPDAFARIFRAFEWIDYPWDAKERGEV